MKHVTTCFLGILILFLSGCHHAVIHTGAYGGHVSTGVSAHVDGDAGAILALSLIGAMVGGAIYEDTHAYRASGYAAIDVNIQPSRAEISLNGVVMGSADDFDGFPEFLVVEPGTHTVKARCAGYQTYEVTVNLAPGQQVNLNKRMEAGTDPVVTTGKVSQDHPRKIAEDAENYLRLEITIDNPDATVYIDGAFIGTGRELALLHAPLLLEPGADELVIVTAENKLQYAIGDMKPDPRDGVVRIHVPANVM